LLAALTIYDHLIAPPFHVELTEAMEIVIGNGANRERKIRKNTFLIEADRGF